MGEPMHYHLPDSGCCPHPDCVAYENKKFIEKLNNRGRQMDDDKEGHDEEILESARITHVKAIMAFETAVIGRQKAQAVVDRADVEVQKTREAAYEAARAWAETRANLSHKVRA